MQEVEVDTNDLKEEDDGYDVEWGVLASLELQEWGHMESTLSLSFF